MPCLMFIKRGIFSFAKRRPLSIFSKKTSVTHRLIRNRYFFLTRLLSKSARKQRDIGAIIKHRAIGLETTSVGNP